MLNMILFRPNEEVCMILIQKKHDIIPCDIWSKLVFPMILFRFYYDFIQTFSWYCSTSNAILLRVHSDTTQRALWSYSLSPCDIVPVIVMIPFIKYMRSFSLSVILFTWNMIFFLLFGLIRSYHDIIQC